MSGERELRRATERRRKEARKKKREGFRRRQRAGHLGNLERGFGDSCGERAGVEGNEREHLADRVGVGGGVGVGGDHCPVTWMCEQGPNDGLLSIIRQLDFISPTTVAYPEVCHCPGFLAVRTVTVRPWECRRGGVWCVRGSFLRLP